MITTTDLFGGVHTIVPCDNEDIDVHFAKIQDVIPSEEVIQFKKRMSECINAGSAYTLSDGSCFLYYLNHKPCCAEGVALYGKQSSVKMLALIYGIFTKIDTSTFVIKMILHKGKKVSEYKSLFTLTSMKRQTTPGYPLVIRVDKLITKIKSVYEKRGINV